MKALVTGITGMAGSFLAEHLLACGDEVLGVSRRGVWPPYVPATLSGRAELMAWDVAAPVSDDVERRVAKFAPDWIFHLAALSVPADCGWPQPTPLALATNVGGTEAVCRLAKRLVSRPRVLLVSSSYVYGDVQASTPKLSEEAPLRPAGGYGKTKLEAEEVLRRCIALGQVEGVIARAFNHTGPRQLPRLMVPQWARQLALPATEPVRIVTRNAWLDLADVRDVVRAYRLLAEHGAPGNAYNVGTGRAVRSGDVLEALLRLCGSQRAVVESSPGERRNPIADIASLQRQTGWSPEIPLEQTLADTLEFWRTRPFG